MCKVCDLHSPRRCSPIAEHVEYEGVWGITLRIQGNCNGSNDVEHFQMINKSVFLNIEKPQNCIIIDDIDALFCHIFAVFSGFLSVQHHLNHYRIELA